MDIRSTNQYLETKYREKGPPGTKPRGELAKNGAFLGRKAQRLFWLFSETGIARLFGFARVRSWRDVAFEFRRESQPFSRVSISHSLSFFLLLSNLFPMNALNASNTSYLSLTFPLWVPRSLFVWNSIIIPSAIVHSLFSLDPLWKVPLSKDRLLGNTRFHLWNMELS